MFRSQRQLVTATLPEKIMNAFFPPNQRPGEQNAYRDRSRIRCVAVTRIGGSQGDVCSGRSPRSSVSLINGSSLARALPLSPFFSLSLSAELHLCAISPRRNGAEPQRDVVGASPRALWEAEQPRDLQGAVPSWLLGKLSTHIRDALLRCLKKQKESKEGTFTWQNAFFSPIPFTQWI